MRTHQKPQHHIRRVRVAAASAIVFVMALIGGALAFTPATPADARDSLIAAANGDGSITGSVIGGGRGGMQPPAGSGPTAMPVPGMTPPPGSTPDPTEVPFVGCTLTQGYWKNHASTWPVNSLTIGGKAYTQNQLMAIFNTPPKGDVTYVLFHQLIAAKMNVAAGADGSVASEAIAAGDAWLIANPLGSKPRGTTANTGSNYATTLDNYNNGVTGPGHCADGPLPTPEPTGKKVRLCHSTSSHTNPYNDINVSVNSVRSE